MKRHRQKPSEEFRNETATAWISFITEPMPCSISPEGGKVALSVTRQGRYIHLSVWNTTIVPVEKQNLSHIFAWLYHLDSSRSTQTDGCGIGLSVANMITVAAKPFFAFSVPIVLRVCMQELMVHSSIQLCIVSTYRSFARKITRLDTFFKSGTSFLLGRIPELGCYSNFFHYVCLLPSIL